MGLSQQDKSLMSVQLPWSSKNIKMAGKLHVKNILHVIHISQLHSFQDLYMGYIIYRSFVSREKQRHNFISECPRIQKVSFTLSVFHVIAWEGNLITPPKAPWRQRFLPDSSVFRCGTELIVFKGMFLLI